MNASPNVRVPGVGCPIYTTAQVRSIYPWPLAREILTEPLRIERGEPTVPRGPGLGVQIDESALERYPWIPGPWSFFTLLSPAETWAVTADHSIPWAAG